MDRESHVSEMASISGLCSCTKVVKTAFLAKRPWKFKITILRMDSCVLLRVWLELQIIT